VSRAAELARSRASAGLSEEDCLIWFGVGRATLERVEAGEILPGAELEHRIDRFLQFCGGGPLFPAAPCPPLAHGVGPIGAGASGAGPGVLFGDQA
jgi:hypothetical protein